jgi:AAA ATPase-like protein
MPVACIARRYRGGGPGPLLNGSGPLLHIAGHGSGRFRTVTTGTVGGLLERATELAALSARLDAVEAGGRGHVVLLGGEAGVGKTALIRELCDGRAGSARIVRGACEPLFTPRPLGPLNEIAHELDGDLVPLVERGAKPYEVVTALMHELDGPNPVVFVLDDLHWADEATLDVFRLLVRRVESVPVLVVAGYRDDEVDVADPLRIVLGELATRPTISRMKLIALSPAAVAELAEPYGVDADELYAKTAGNPFFVVEALAAGSGAIPDTVRDAVLARAARLTPPGRSLLEAVAVVPPQAELWLLEALADPATGLDECLASRMLRSDAAGISFRHELARLAVEDSVATGRKLTLHRSALAALAEPPAGAPDFARLAHHAEAAGDADAVRRYAPAAAERADALGAHREAAAHYARVLRRGGDLAPSERAGAARAAVAGLVPLRRHRRCNRGGGGGARAPSRPRSEPGGGRVALLALRHPLVPGLRRRVGRRRRQGPCPARAASAR